MSAILDSIKVLFNKKKNNADNLQNDEDAIMQNISFIDDSAPEKENKSSFRISNLFKPQKSSSFVDETPVSKTVTTKKADKNKSLTTTTDGKKIALICVLLVILCGVSYYVYDLFSKDFGSNGGAETKVATHKNSKEKKSSQLSNYGNIPTIPPNPFTATKELPQLAVADGVQTAKVVQQPKYVSIPQTSPPAARVEARPSIPVQSRVLPNVPKPASLPPSASQTPRTAGTAVNPIRVQGVMSADDGTSIAIMGDGSVLSEGESFLDSRISFIDDNGVVLENGRTIKFDLNE